MAITFNTFKASLEQQQPPADLSAAAIALWYDAKGNWAKAHSVIQEEPGQEAARIHGYLHRKEGDAFNARYWYDRAACPFPAATLAEEWIMLVNLALG